MITIPSYGPSQVAPTGTPSVRVQQDAPIENFGGGQAVASAAGAVSQAAKDANDVFLEQKKQADNAIGQDVYAKLTAKKNDLIYNPQSGALTKKGQDALGVTNSFGDQYNKYADDLAGTLQNDEQRRQFEHFKRVVGGDLNDTLTKYTFDQSQKLQVEISQNAVKTAQEDGILNYHDAGKVESSIELQSNLLTNTMKAAGQPQAVIDHSVAEAKSTTYAGVIDRMLVNGQDMAARSYYNQVKSSLTASDTVAIEKSLETGNMRGESQRRSDDIVDKNDNMSDALEEARKIEDPKLRDETSKRVKEYFSDQSQAKKQDEDDRFEEASGLLEKTKNLNSIPPQMWANMSSSQHRSLETRFTQLRDGIEPQSNGETYYNLQQTAVTPELRDKFLGTNLLEYRHQVTSGELSSLMDMQKSMRKSDGEADDTIRGLRTRTQVVNETLKSIGIDPNAKDSGTANKVLQFQRQIDDQIAEYNKTNNKKPNATEMQKMADNLVVQATVPNSGFLWNTSGPAFTLPKGTSVTVGIDDIPASEKAAITKALNARSIPVTNEKIEELYSRKINGARQRGQ